MNELSFLSFMEEVLELNPGSINLKSELIKLKEWDSIGKLSLIVQVSQKFNKKLTNDIIKTFNTFEDIYNFIK
jgi:acyl carrier protein